MTKQGLETQKVLKALAREIKFESVMFADVFGYSTREPLRYYLWMRELELWLFNTHKIKPVGKRTTISYSTELLQQQLKQTIEFNQTLNKLPKKENK